MNEVRYLITWLLIILAICCVMGILTEKIALGIVFTMSLFITLYGMFALLQKKEAYRYGTYNCYSWNNVFSLYDM